MNGRGGCWEIPSERVVMLLWLKRTYPTGWQKFWARIARAWRQ